MEEEESEGEGVLKQPTPPPPPIAEARGEDRLDDTARIGRHSLTTVRTCTPARSLRFSDSNLLTVQS